MLAERIADVFLADKFEEKKTTQTDIPIAAKEAPTKDELTRYAGI
jgi:hypothetical protein